VEALLGEKSEAIKLLQAGTDRLPSQVDEKITALARVHEEKLSNSIQPTVNSDLR
jgi:hypothetical protein